MSAHRLALAIDGGGTKTLACLVRGTCEADGQLLGCGTAGASNPAAVGLSSAQSSLRAATEMALQAAGIAGATIDSAIIGLAGLEATGWRQPLREWMMGEFAISDVRVVTDVELLLYAGQRELPAIVLISGTGSAAFGRHGDRLARCGGRGYLLGDEGSGFWIGQRGMMAAIRALDHAAPATALVDLIGERLGATTAEQWTQQVYAVPDVRQLISQMSQQVVAAANSGDDVALRILESASQELAKLVVSVAHQLQVGPQEFDLILAGGILTNVGQVRHGLQCQLDSRLPPHDVRTIAAPADAAARRALAG